MTTKLNFPFDYIKSDGQPGDSFCKIGSKITPQQELNYYNTLTENIVDDPTSTIQKLRSRVEELEKKQESQKYDPSKYPVQPGPLLARHEHPIQNIYLVGSSGPKCPLPKECPPPPPPCPTCPAEKICPECPICKECPPPSPPCHTCPVLKEKVCPPLECPECPNPYKECRKSPCPALDCTACKDFQERAFKLQQEITKAEAEKPKEVQQPCPVTPSEPVETKKEEKKKKKGLRLEQYLLIIIIVLILAAIMM